MVYHVENEYGAPPLVVLDPEWGDEQILQYFNTHTTLKANGVGWFDEENFVLYMGDEEVAFVHALNTPD